MARVLGGHFSWWCPGGTLFNRLCPRGTLLSVLGDTSFGSVIQWVVS